MCKNKTQTKIKKRVNKHAEAFRLCFSLLTFVGLLNLFGVVIGFVQGSTVTSISFYFKEGSYLWTKLYCSHYQFFMSFFSANFLARILETLSSNAFNPNPSLSLIAWYVIVGIYSVLSTVIFLFLTSKASSGKNGFILAILIFLCVDSFFLIPVVCLGESNEGIIIPLAIRIVSFILLLIGFIELLKYRKDNLKETCEV